MLDKKDDVLDVSTMLEGNDYEEKTIAPAEAEQEHRQADRPQKSDNRLKEDLKLSYTATGVLDVTVGGYGFLRQDYTINPNKDIYVSTSQIRRFWLRRGDMVEGLARPPKEGERFHSLLLIKR